MDYNKVKLGLIGKFKVLRERRVAEKNRAWYDKMEGEVTEVDYSVADKLAENLLEQKRIKKATRDASRLYKSIYGKNNDGIAKANFIDDYLAKNGLKQKVLPKPETLKMHSFMDQYPTEKSEKDIAYEKANQEQKVYYRIGDTNYKTCFLFKDWCFREINDEKDSPVPLTTNDGKSYFIQTEKMQPEDKYNMLNKLIDTSLREIGGVLTMSDEQMSPEHPFAILCAKASFIDYITKKLHESEKIEEANQKLEKMTEMIFNYGQEIFKQEQEERE